MIKVIVKSLRAAWPAGTQLGHVVALPFDAIPDSLVGKCGLAPEDATAVADYVPPPPPEPRNPGVGLVPLHTQPAAAGDDEELAIARALLAEAQTEAAELRGQVTSLTDSRTKLADQLADTARQLVEAQAALAKAEEALQAKGKAKA